MKTFVIDTEAYDGEDDEPGMVLRLGIRSSSEPGLSPHWIATSVKTIDELSKIVDGLKSELDGTIEDAKELLSSVKEKILSEEKIETGMEPGKIWKIICQSPEDDFIRVFNALTESDRKAVANYVLTEENIFKGRALIFSQCFDYRTHIMVEE